MSASRVPVEVHLLDSDGVDRGIVTWDEALRLARDAGLDLCEVAPDEQPPRYQIQDYGLWKYEQAKRKRGE